MSSGQDVSTVEPRVSLALRGVRLLLTLLSLAVLAVVLAFWFWKFYLLSTSASNGTSGSSQSVTTDVAVAKAGDWLSGGQSNNDPSQSAPLSQQAASVALVLKGALAAGDGQGTAVLAGNEQSKGRDRTARVGDALASGVTLRGVYATWIEVDSGGKTERIDLDWRARGQQLARSGVSLPSLPTASTNVSGFSIGMTPTAPAAQQPAQAFTLDVTRSGNEAAFSRRQLDNTLKDASMLNRLGQVGPAPGGGARIVMAPAGSLLERIGLQTGDVITNINGTRVNTPGDLAGLYQQFGTTNRINAEVTRQGATIRLNFTVNP
jgi:general secretion pathway protein C